MIRRPALPANALASCLLLAATQGVGVSDAAAAKTAYQKADMPNDPVELFTKGATLVATDELDAAEKLAREALQRHPTANGFHLLLGDVFARRKRFADAFYEWQWELLRAGPESHTGKLVANRVSAVLSSQRGIEVDEVRVVLDAVMITPTDPATAVTKLRGIERGRGDRFALKLLLAEALQAGGASDEAIAIYRELVARDEYFVPAYIQLAVLLERKGQKDEANRFRVKARGIDPENWRFKM